MTQEQYLNLLAEKINENKEDKVDDLSLLKLVLTYNKRYLTKIELGEFEEKSKEEYLKLLTSANLFDAENNQEKLDEAFKLMLALCDSGVQKAFSLGSTRQKGVYNVHNLVTALETSDKKENIRDARKIADFDLASCDVKKEYLYTKTDAEVGLSMLFDKSKFDAFHARVASVSEDVVRQKLEEMAKIKTENFAREQDKYFARVVEEVIKEDIRISSAANNTKINA